MKVNPIGQYILDEQGTPVLEPDSHRWSEWCFGAGGISRRRIAKTSLRYGEETLLVSTVFLGIPHPMVASSDTALFETMVFGEDETLRRLCEMAEQPTQSIMTAFLEAIGGSDLAEAEIQRRYVTRDEAVQGHAQMVQFVEVAVSKLILSSL